MRLMNSQRGVSSFYSIGLVANRFEKNDQITRFSVNGIGRKISINKGTKSTHIIKKPFLGIPHKNRIIIVNRGTQRLII